MILPDEIQPKFFHKIGFCDSNNCPSYDGKRCRLLGFKPSEICEPWCQELIRENEENRELCKYVSDDTPLQSDDYTRGEDKAHKQIKEKITKWLNDEESIPNMGDNEWNQILHKINSLKYIRKLWSEGTIKLQNIIQKYNLGKAGDDVFDIAVKEINLNHTHRQSTL